MEKNITVGILAHVDAGKTTLTEALLYLSGKIKKLGRVDHRDSFLDNHQLERDRGITIFSKQAIIDLPHTRVTLLDTPGHVDFSAETERSLQVLDYAVLVISGTDGVQAHTKTLWQLLEKYNLPCFIFVTKMDLKTCDHDALMGDICRNLGHNCVDFSLSGGELEENIATSGEGAMDLYLREGKLRDEDISSLIARREIFPCLFGSGIKTQGVDGLIRMLDEFTRMPPYGEDFAAKVFKISRDGQGNRLTFIKLTGGSLAVRCPVKYTGLDGENYEEKITQMRLYSGIKYETADKIYPGQVCALTGLNGTYPGLGLGREADGGEPILESVLSYSLILPPQTDAKVFLPKLMQLQEEDPQLHILWNEQTKSISVQLMGKVQSEIFKSLVKERFDVDIALDAGRIMYKETIKNKVEGVGHFEPLRHYAEVHLLLEPLPQGSGIVIDSLCPQDHLDRNWQRLILTNLAEKTHLGVLTGAPITDIRISLADGKAHLKHTEGGDFRQAVYRAVRQGLMQAESVLLEPWYSFTLDVPTEQIGRAISDIRSMNGIFDSPEDMGEFSRLTGSAPVLGLNEYMGDVMNYTRGRGRLSLIPDGYRPCKNQDEIVSALGYDPCSDPENTPDSVFCAHGAGYNVRWDEVFSLMHLPAYLKPEKESAYSPAPLRYAPMSIDDKELEAIMTREFGPIKRPEYAKGQLNCAPTQGEERSDKKKYLIVDGYNLIFAWDELTALARESLELARGRLMDILSGYCGFTKAELVLVFDGFRTPGNPGSKSDYHNIHVVYTKDGETGDAYIERLVSEIGKNYAVRVITSDNLIRLSAIGSGVLRTHSSEFIAELKWTMNEIDSLLKKSNLGAHKTPLSNAKEL